MFRLRSKGSATASSGASRLRCLLPVCDVLADGVRPTQPILSGACSHLIF